MLEHTTGNPLGNATENPGGYLRCRFLVCDILPLKESFGFGLVGEITGAHGAPLPYYYYYYDCLLFTVIYIMITTDYDGRPAGRSFSAGLGLTQVRANKHLKLCWKMTLKIHLKMPLKVHDDFRGADFWFAIFCHYQGSREAVCGQRVVGTSTGASFAAWRGSLRRRV